jgi:hypothetical protein
VSALLNAQAAFSRQPLHLPNRSTEQKFRQRLAPRPAIHLHNLSAVGSDHRRPAIFTGDFVPAHHILTQTLTLRRQTEKEAATHGT